MKCVLRIRSRFTLHIRGNLLSSLLVSRTGSASDWCGLQEALYKCIDTIQYSTTYVDGVTCNCSCELDVGDHLIEVVGLMNSIHVAQVKGGIQAGRRLAQCSSVVIR